MSFVKICRECLKVIPPGQLKNDDTTCPSCLERQNENDLLYMTEKEYHSFSHLMTYFSQKPEYHNNDRLKSNIQEYLDKYAFSVTPIQSLDELKLPETLRWENQMGDSASFTANATIVYQPTKYDGIVSPIIRIGILVSFIYFLNHIDILLKWDQLQYFEMILSNGLDSIPHPPDFIIRLVVTLIVVISFIRPLRSLYKVIKAKKTYFWIDIDYDKLILSSGTNKSSAKQLTVSRSPDVSFEIEQFSNAFTDFSCYILVTDNNKQSKIGYRLPRNAAQEIVKVLFILTHSTATK